MYTYVKSLSLSRGFGGVWSAEDLLYRTLVNIYNTTSKFYLTLKEPVTDREVHVDMNELKLEFSTYNNTVENWLIDIGNRALPEISQLPDTIVKYAKFSNAIQAGYRLSLAKRGYAVDDSAPMESLPDLRLTRPGFDTDLSLIHTHCLATVHGLLHNTDTNGEVAYAIDAGKVIHKRGYSHVGLVSFLDIGKVTKVKIKEDDIHRLEPDTPLSDKVVFTVDEPLEGKSYMLSMGGYLVTPEEGVFWRSGEKSFSLNLQSLNYMERYLESKDIIDLSSLGLPPSDINPNVVSLEDLMSGATIKKYLTLSQSFLVIVDTPMLAFNKIHIRTAHVPGRFTSFQDPSYPLVVGYGRLGEYWKTEEAGYWSLSLPDTFYRNFIAGQQPTQFIKMVNDHLLSSPPYFLSRGHLLEIAGTPTE